MSAPTLHIVFNPSAAAELQHGALQQADRDERVVSLFDCLSFGPINPPDPDLRRKWVEEELGYSGWEAVVGETTSFWPEALSTSYRRIAWLSRRSAREYAGFPRIGCGGLATNQSRLSTSPTSWWRETRMGRPNRTWPLASDCCLCTQFSKTTCSTVRKNLSRSRAPRIENYGDALERKTRNYESSAKVNLYPRRCHFLTRSCCRPQHPSGKRRRWLSGKLWWNPGPRQ